MSWKFWKKKESKESGPNPHVELDPEIEEIPEIRHDIVLGLLQDSKKITSEEFLANKYGLTPLLIREYRDFLVQKGLLRMQLRRDGRIDRVELTEKGRSFIARSELSSQVAKMKRGH